MSEIYLPESNATDKEWRNYLALECAKLLKKFVEVDNDRNAVIDQRKGLEEELAQARAEVAMKNMALEKICGLSSRLGYDIGDSGVFALANGALSSSSGKEFLDAVKEAKDALECLTNQDWLVEEGDIKIPIDKACRVLAMFQKIGL